jgi:hypothetical protein
MTSRFFVTIYASDKRALANLRNYDLDLIRATTAAVTAVTAEAIGVPAAAPNYSVEGLLTVADVERLVTGGYQVLVREDAAVRARARTQTISFEEWLQGMEEG